MLTDQVTALSREKDRRQELELELLKLRASVGSSSPTTAGALALSVEDAKPAVDGAGGTTGQGQNGVIKNGSDPSPEHLQQALSLYYRELQTFMVRHGLEDAVAPATVELAPPVSDQLLMLVKSGVEFVKLVLHASGPGAAELLRAGTAVGSSAPDSQPQWQQVVQRTRLSPEQMMRVRAWRGAFQTALDDCYGKRLVLKAKVGCHGFIYNTLISTSYYY